MSASEIQSVYQIEARIRAATAEVASELFQVEVNPDTVNINRTPKDFSGQYTVVVFPFVRHARKSPEETGNVIGAALQSKLPEIKSFNTVKGFLNLELNDSWWTTFLQTAWGDKKFGTHESTGKTVVLEYCGPNTNKPLHLGHIRNMLLGWSTAEILSAAGDDVHKVNIYNDRGIAICKSMAVYLREGNGSTPESEGVKGDHFVGGFYVNYAAIAAEESTPFLEEGLEKRDAEKQTAIFKEAQDLLLKWEAGDEETLALWRQMNNWVYQGFNETYARIGVDFEKDYLESDTYTLGRDMVLEGVEAGVFKRYEDGSVRADMTEEGLDEKLLLRSDGSSMYITQDLGTAELRYKDYSMDSSIYVVASEQDYHFKVLQILLAKLGRKYADGIYHHSYGLVELPDGRMKTREGTTVDADELCEKMIEEAKAETAERGKIDEFSEREAQELYETLSLGALKYFILKVDPRKRIVFDPKESIELQGDTGPFIQYGHARICSILRKYGKDTESPMIPARALEPAEVELIALISRYPATVKEAAAKYSPAEIANYAFELAKLFNKFYDRCPVLTAETEEDVKFRIALSDLTARVIRKALALLGIRAPERM